MPHEPVLGLLGFQPRVPIAVQFGHREWGLQVCAWADGGVPRHGTHVLGVGPTEAMLEEDLKSSGHGVVLSKRQGPDDKIRREGRFRNRDYAACPFTMGRIRAVILVDLPQPEGEGL